MKIVPTTITDAKAFIARNHRHCRPPQGGLFAIAVEHEGELRGVVVVGRPVARAFDDGSTCEVVRLTTDGTKNACSALYGAATRAAKALGYERMFTYTLAEEPGSSLRASGWTLDRHLSERPSWDCRARKRVQVDLFGEETRPPGPKIRWVKKLSA